MVVLSRLAGQKIVIGNETTLEVISVSGEGVRIGISAPNDTSVHQFEIFSEIREANRVSEVDSEAIERTALKELSAILRQKQ